MEFERNSPITDEQRVLAATKKVVIQPINSSIVRDEAIEPPTIHENHPNIDRDTENTSNSQGVIQPSNGAAGSTGVIHHYYRFGFIFMGLIAGILAGVLFFAYIG